MGHSVSMSTMLPYRSSTDEMLTMRYYGRRDALHGRQHASNDSGQNLLCPLLEIDKGYIQGLVEKIHIWNIYAPYGGRHMF